MGWIGFGIGMGFRTMRYSRYAVRSVARTSRRRCPRRSNSSAGSGLAAAAIVIAALCALGSHATSTYADPTSTYGPPGKYGYGMDSGTGRISALNTPPGTQPAPGQHTVFVITFPKLAATNQRDQDKNVGVIVGLVLVAFLVAGLFLFLPKTKPAGNPRGPQPPDGPVNPRMYYSNRR